jgi:hypothetical protein
LFLFRWLQLLLVWSQTSCSTLVSLFINIYILVSFLLPFAWHFCPLVLSHVSLRMFSCLLLSIISGLFTITSLSLCTFWFHNTVPHLHAHTLTCVCVYHFSVVSIPSPLHTD